MAIPIKAQVFDMHMSEYKWESAVVLCDGSLYLTDNWGKMYAVDRTYFGQVMKEFLNVYLTRYNETRRLRNNLIREGKHVEAERAHEHSKNIENDISELKKVWKAFKSFSTRHKNKVPEKNNSKISLTWTTSKGKDTSTVLNAWFPSFWS